MKRTTKMLITLAALGFAGLVGTQVLAQGGPMMSGGPMGQGASGPMMMGAIYDQTWFESLKKRLAITPSQETAWNTYVTAAQSAAQSMQDTHNNLDFKALQAMTPQQQRDFMQGMHEQRLDQMTAVAQARDALIKVLDEKQAGQASTLLGGFGMGGYGMGGYGMGPGMMGYGGFPDRGTGPTAPTTK